MEIFWRTIAYYNSATWLLQIIVILIGIVLTALLISKPRPWVKMGMKIYMIGLYSWISIVYYFIYCEERSYNGVMAMFWGVMAIIWIWIQSPDIRLSNVHTNMICYLMYCWPCLSYILWYRWHAGYLSRK